jgi:hypothetical protein
MKTSFVRGSGLLFAYLVSSALVQAHPGHDDHGLTWDFSHLAAHPLATLGWIASLLGAGAAGWFLLRRATRFITPFLGSRVSRPHSSQDRWSV